MNVEIKSLALGAIVAVGLVLSYSAGAAAQRHQEPRLIGMNCMNAHDALYAYEEDDFPPCDVIQKR